jgi:hypothetical protein
VEEVVVVHEVEEVLVEVIVDVKKSKRMIK